MDAFFASVEQRDNPALRGIPVAVTGADERTVITTASYEARTYGVKTGITVYQAIRLCPQLTLVIGNNRKYAQICTSLQEICLRFTPDAETYSMRSFLTSPAHITSSTARRTLPGVSMK